MVGATIRQPSSMEHHMELPHNIMWDEEEELDSFLGRLSPEIESGPRHPSSQ